jgi:hypothetical protein
MQNHLGLPWGAQHATGRDWNKRRLAFRLLQMRPPARALVFLSEIRRSIQPPGWGPLGSPRRTSLLCLAACLTTFSAQAQDGEVPAPDEEVAPGGIPPQDGGEGPDVSESEASGEDAQSTGTDEEPAPEAPTEPEGEAPEVPAESETQDSIDPEAGEEPDYYGADPFAPSLRMTEYQEPEKPPYTGPFRAGQISLGLSIGFQATADQAWFVPGVGIGYFLVNGLQVRVDTDFWIGDPFIATPSPGLEYVFWMLPVVNPYLGGFYRHYFVSGDYLDADSVGARGGLYILTGGRSYFGGGVVYERILQDHLFTQQDLIYPEITFVFSF